MPGNSRRPASMREQLAVVPVRNAAAVVDRADREVRIRVRVATPRWLAPLARLARLPSHRTYILEGYGLETWDAIDGGSTIEAIIEAFAHAHALSFHEARAMILGYLGTLAARGLIAVIGQQPRAQEDDLQI